MIGSSRSRDLGRYNNSMGAARHPGGRSSLGSTLGAGAGTAFRRLRGKPGRNQRIFRGFRSGAVAFLATARSALHVLFLEVSGLIFLLFTISVIGAFIREYRKYALHQVGLERVILAGAIAGMFLYFGLSSFWRARRRRSGV